MLFRSRAGRRQLADLAQQRLELVGGDGSNVLRGAQGEEPGSPARVRFPDAHTSPLQGDGRAPQDFLAARLERLRKCVSHAYGAGRHPLLIALASADQGRPRINYTDVAFSVPGKLQPAVTNR